MAIPGDFYGRDFDRVDRVSASQARHAGRIAWAKLMAKIAEDFPLAPARGPPTAWAGLVQAHDDHDAIQASPDDLAVIDIRGL